MKVHILLESGRLKSYAEEIRAVAEDSFTRASEILGVSDVDVVIGDDSGSAIPEIGVGGYTPTSHLVLIWTDPDNPVFKSEFRKEIRGTITHEFHHAIRNRAIPYRSDTLLGALITEGLADHFDIELNGGDPPPWNYALSDIQLQDMRNKAESKFSDTSYDHAAWFFGTTQEIPRWTGYSLGFKIVGDYLRKTGKKASELVAEPSASFIGT